MEVIYTGLHQTPEQIVETVIQEDADAVGLSILSGAHMTLVPRIVELLREQGIDDVLVTVGGHDPGRRHPGAQGARGRRGLHARARRRRRSSTSSRAPSSALSTPRDTAGASAAAAIDSSVNGRDTIAERPFALEEALNVKICVLVKEVPDAAVQKRIDPSTGRMDRSGEKNLNPYDTHAIEAAMQIKEGGAVDGRRDRRRDHGPRVRRARAAQGRLAGRRPLGPPDRRRARRLRRRRHRLRAGQGARDARAPTSSCSASSPTTASATRSAPSWPTTCRCRR